MSHRFRLSVFSSIVTGVALAAYPLLVYLGLTYWDLRSFSLVIVVLFILRLAAFRFGNPSARQVLHKALIAVSLFGLCLAGISFLRNSDEAMLFYPASVNCLLFLVFGFSLLRPPTIIERIARLRDAELPDRAVVYTRRVTVVWMVFFAINGIIAFYTAVASPLEIWTLYNGAITYVLIGLIFAIEYCWRTYALRLERT